MVGTQPGRAEGLVLEDRREVVVARRTQMRRRDLTRATKLLLAAALAVLVVATPGAPTLAQAPKRGGVFRLPAPDAVSLDPHQPGFTSQMYASLVYSHLVRFPAGPEATGSGDHRILPDLAETWESPSPTTVVVTLRKGVHFHRKPPVTATRGPSTR